MISSSSPTATAVSLYTGRIIFNTLKGKGNIQHIKGQGKGNIQHIKGQGKGNIQHIKKIKGKGNIQHIKG